MLLELIFFSFLMILPHNRDGPSTPLNCTMFCGNYKGNRGHNPTLMEVCNLMGD